MITRLNGQAPSGGGCPASGYSGSTVVTSPDTSVASGSCYVYAITGTDKVGNSDSATSSPVLVDTSAPTDPVFVSISGVGTSQYYTGSGTTIYFAPGADNTNQFTLTASSNDPQSGVTYSFPHISGFTETPGSGPGQERYVASNPTAVAASRGGAT